MTLPIPSEDQESEALANFCRLNGLLFAHINNELFTKSWKQKNRQVRLGTAKGVPDYLVVLPPGRTHDHVGRLLCIELKRVKNGTVSEAQKQWIAALNGLDSLNIIAGVCKGADSAIETINTYLKGGDINHESNF